MAYFLARLLAPRPTFPADMTAEEKVLMGEHGAYLSQLSAAGTAVLFGPVMDPKGAWGMAVLAANDEAEARALTARDPVVLAGRGFSYEVLPMMQAVLSPAAFQAAAATQGKQEQGAP